MKKRNVLLWGALLLCAGFFAPGVLNGAELGIPAEKWSIATAGDTSKTTLLGLLRRNVKSL